MSLLLVFAVVAIYLTVSEPKERKASLVVLPPLVLGYDELYLDSTETRKQSLKFEKRPNRPRTTEAQDETTTDLPIQERTTLTPIPTKEDVTFVWSMEKETTKKKSTTKKKTSKKTGKDKGKTPKGKTPKGKTPKGKTPKGKTPKGKTPKGKTPKGKTPKGKTPKGKTPKGKPPKDNKKKPPSKKKTTKKSLRYLIDGEELQEYRRNYRSLLKKLKKEQTLNESFDPAGQGYLYFKKKKLELKPFLPFQPFDSQQTS